MSRILVMFVYIRKVQLPEILQTCNNSMLQTLANLSNFVSKIQEVIALFFLGGTVVILPLIFEYLCCSTKLQHWRAVECELEFAIIICKSITLTR